MRKKYKHSKGSDIIHEKLELQSYLKSDNVLNSEEKQLLFKFRTRMTEMKMNFKNNFSELKCKLGCDELDEQRHLFECDVLLSNSDILSNNVTVEYEDIFSQETTKQINSIKLLSHIWSIRQKLL